MTGTPRLAGLLIRFRMRHAWNAFRARPAGPTGFIALLALASSVAYVLLFASAFDVIGHVSGVAAQAAALSVMIGAVALSSFGSKAAAGDAVVAGTPENEFLLARPLSMATLVAARSLAALATDPFGALFLFPVLIAAALAWHLPAAAWAVAVVVSLSAQLAIAAAAQATQIAIVRWVPRRHRWWAWVTLRLGSLAALALVWMSATSILRSPSRFAPRVLGLAGVLSFTPGRWLAAPLIAFRATGGAAAVLTLIPIVVGALAIGATAVVIARHAGLWGWEDAGAPGADGAPPLIASRPPLTPVRREWRNLVRDRARLSAFAAVPIILVGSQVLGTIGWRWSTATVDRIAVLTFSVMLYMATLGPLGHMQTERRAFWIMRAVPISVGKLMAAKAWAWSVILVAVAVALFAALATGVAHPSAAEVVRAGVLVVVGTVGMTLLAVGSACVAADFSDDQRPALGPGRVYLFLVVGGLYNVVLRAHGGWVWAALGLYAAVVASTWRAGIAQARICFDAEALTRRRFRASDAVTLLLIATFGPAVLTQALLRMEAPRSFIQGAQVAAVAAVVLVGVGMFVKSSVVRRPPTAGSSPAIGTLRRGGG